jgi:hypothetical protein
VDAFLLRKTKNIVTTYITHEELVQPSSNSQEVEWATGDRWLRDPTAPVACSTDTGGHLEFLKS